MRNTPLAVYLFLKNEEIKNYFCKESLYSNEELGNNKNIKDEIKNIFGIILDACMNDVKITHSNNEAVIAAAFYDFVILSILGLVRKNYSQEEIINKVLKKIDLLINFEFFVENKNEEFEKFAEKIKDIIKNIDDIKNFDDKLNNDYIINIGKINIGYYLNSFVLIFFVFKFFSKFENYSNQNAGCKDSTNLQYKIYRNIMNFICDIGGDTDTNCAIIGGLIGPLLGINEFGEEYKDLLKFYPFSLKNKEDKRFYCKRPFLYSPGVIAIWVIYLNNKNLKDR